MLYVYAMKEIPLTQGKVALVDDEDYEALSQYSWHASYDRTRKMDHQHLAQRSSKIAGKWRSVLMHREILQALPGVQVDHIDGNPLNNQRANLRLCSARENSHNRRLSARNTSGFKGVTYCKRTKAWLTSICADGRKKHLGYFEDKIEAAKAYDRAASELHGEFAYLNFPA
jgi:hypothetical protein